MPVRVPWAELGPEFFSRWGYPNGKWQPEHLEILGPNGSGKSYFETVVLKTRAARGGPRIVMIATKPADETLTDLGWPIIDKWPPNYKQDQVIFWARAQGLTTAGRAIQRRKIMDVLEKLWVKRSNTIVSFDEIAYLQHELHMGTVLTTYYREARALGITVVASTQRPQGITRWMHSESAWSVSFRPKDEEDAERVAQVLGSKRFYKDILLGLSRERHEFLMVRTLTGEAHISALPFRGTHS